MRLALTFSATDFKKAVEDLGNNETPRHSRRGRKIGKHAEKEKMGQNVWLPNKSVNNKTKKPKENRGSTLKNIKKNGKFKHLVCVGDEGI